MKDIEKSEGTVVEDVARVPTNDSSRADDAGVAEKALSGDSSDHNTPVRYLSELEKDQCRQYSDDPSPVHAPSGNGLLVDRLADSTLLVWSHSSLQ